MQAYYVVCPLDAFFPLPLNDKLEDKFGPGSSAYNFSLTKLKEWVTELRLRKDRNRFHFYFGDSLELCITNEEWKNKMHVIHCSDDLVSYARLGNILPIVSQCLTSDMPEAVLVTEFFLTKLKKKLSLFDSVEFELNCPLTLTPTVYGVRLLDHISLGSTICRHLNDSSFIGVPHTLKWYKAPFAYSNETRLQISPHVKDIVSHLVGKFFIQASELYCFPPMPPTRRMLLSLYFQNKLYHRESPMTLYNILRSMFNCNIWAEDAIESLIRKCFPLNFQLAWKTLQQWMAGEEVILFYNNDDNNNVREAILNSQDRLTNITCVKIVLKPTDSKSRHRPGEILDDDFFSNAHHVYNLNWKESNPEFAISFLLTKNHQLDFTATQFMVIEFKTNKLLYSTDMTSQSMQRQLIVNSNPHPFARHLTPSSPSHSAYCCELEYEYYLLVSVQSQLQGSEGTCSHFN